MNRSKAREPVRRASSSGPPTASAISAHAALVLESSQIGDDPTRQDRRDLRGKRLRRIQPGEHALGIGVQIDAAMLLRGSRYRRDAADVESAGGYALENRLERLRPHDRRGERFVRLGARQHAVIGPVLRKGLVER